MTIKEAKEQIKQTVQAYLTKDEYGQFCIPLQAQRPLFLMGPPGIGKTAVMEQVASELNIGLVSYSMTHHTRQSALGLPFIVKKTYSGAEYDVSEYTMSEILATVYDTIERTGKTEGLLFLDEINCVSETLIPAMLQFLQFKTFGRHRVPDGWIVVTAGNPPEYNHSVREFDVVTWDRLKRIDIEPDLNTWKEYAYKKNVHPSILTYLDIKKDDFYRVETTVDGKQFVTARGWSDLSDMITLYERCGFAVDKKLVEQYVQNRAIAKSFANYYDLFKKYRSDYQIDRILDGSADESIKQRAKNAKFDERLALLGLLLDALIADCRSIRDEEAIQAELLKSLKVVQIGLNLPQADVLKLLGEQIKAKKHALTVGMLSSSLSTEQRNALHGSVNALEAMIALFQGTPPTDGKAAFMLLKKEYDARTKAIKATAETIGEKLTAVFRFCEEVFGDGQELLILVTELTVSYHTAHFIGRYGCPEYFNRHKELLFFERQKDILRELELLELTD